ncbi:hypothetical protein TWF694_001567 [Orbilia ellipsospora]|uniref:Nephrocystin 3-like N-terminal domain-containing protein n=1 Tax=Orbilia ellipsospora TaxID=2528407 RepID=A0AAV9XS52_9PEZI
MSAMVAVQKEVLSLVVTTGNVEPSRVPAALTPSTPGPTALDGKSDDSEIPSSCWEYAKISFRKELVAGSAESAKEDSKKDAQSSKKTTKSSQKLVKREEEVAKLNRDIDAFLGQKKSLTSIIKSAEELVKNVEKRYPETLVKCLRIMEKTKEFGDSVLSSAPPIASAVWYGFGLLLNGVMMDVNRCERICDLCYQLSQIVLTCRVFEHKCRDKDLAGDPEVILGALDSISGVLAAALRFIWFADQKFQHLEDKLKGKNIVETGKAMLHAGKAQAKSIWDDHTRSSYELLTLKYHELMSIQQLAFNEIVLTALRDANVRATKAMEYIEDVLFPTMENTRKLVEGVKEMFSYHIELTQEIAADTKDMKGTVNRLKNIMDDAEKKQVITDYWHNSLRARQKDAHTNLLKLTLAPLQLNDIEGSDFGSWLFADDIYENWKHDTSNMTTQPVEGVSVKEDTAQDLCADTSPNAENNSKSSVKPILYLRGDAGFGKSVIMALAIRRLREETKKGKPVQGPRQENEPHIREMGPDKDCLRPVVLFFFFKKGDSSTQLATIAARSLLAQLFNPKYIEPQILGAMWEAVTELNKPQPESGETEAEQPKDRFSYIIGQLEKAAKTIGRRVYLVIDGLDECVDDQQQEILPCLTQLARTSHGIFRILISSRKNDRSRSSSTGGLASRASSNSDSPKDHEHSEDAIIWNINSATNSRDMLSFLNTSLRGLMQRSRLKECFVMDGDKYTLKIKPTYTKFEAIIEKMALHIQERSKGMFTYSAMTITSLRQPSELSLSQRIKDLPGGMDQIYSSQLKALADAERKLIMLALNRIYWSNVCSVEMHTLEIVQQFKRYYDTEPTQAPTDDFDYDHILDNAFEGHSKAAGDGELGDDDVISDNTVEKPKPANTRMPLQHRSSSFYHEHHMTTQMDNPEVADIIYHLNQAGRDFFKFSNDDRNIEFIHTSVREWIDRQTKSEKTRRQNVQTNPILYKQNDEFIFKVSLPRAEIASMSGSMFDSARYAHLSILTYILQVLTHKRFQDAYMPDYKLPHRISKLFLRQQNEGTQLEENDSTTYNEDKVEGKTEEAVHAEDKSPGEPETQTSENKGRKVPWRGEIHHWILHMRRLSDAWPQNKRKGQEWERLFELLEAFTQLKTFWRWSIQYRQFKEEISLMQAQTEWLFWGPMHFSASLELEIYEQFLLSRSQCLDSFCQDLGATNPLHYEDIFYCPERVKELIQTRAYDISSPREGDGRTPFMICLCLVYPEKESATSNGTILYKRLLDSLTILANSDAEMGLDTLFPEEPQLPLHRIMKLGDNSLFREVTKNQSFHRYLSCQDDELRTVLHTIFWPLGELQLPSNLQTIFGKRLLELGANPNAEDMRSRMPLYGAVRSKNIEAVKLLLEFEYPDGKKVIVDDTDDVGETALISLVSIIRDEDFKIGLEIIDVLIEHGASLDAPPNSRVRAPFLSALWNENPEYVDRILYHQARVSPDSREYLFVRDQDYDPALHCALYDWDEPALKMIRCLLEHTSIAHDD